MTTSYARKHVYRMISPDRVESGAGKIDEIAKSVRRYGARRVLIATSNSVMNKTPNVKRLEAALGDIAYEIFPTCRQHSPEQDIFDMVDHLSDFDAQAVVSIGGSSVFDTVKVAVARHANDPDGPVIPQIAIPTTLSAGEFTPGAGYTEARTQSKKLVLDMRVAPKCVILDPEVTIDTPEELWLSTGVKALDHGLEAVWAIKPHPYVDALALDAIRLLFEYLPKSRDKSDIEARAACQLGAWMSIAGAGASGMRLSHFLGHQIGARLHIPHGITSCILLPSVMRYLRDKTLEPQVRIAASMGVVRGPDCTDEDLADAAADRLEALIKELGLPGSIKAAGGSLDDVDAITESSYQAATQLGLAGDLPKGAESIREILMQA